MKHFRELHGLGVLPRPKGTVLKNAGLCLTLLPLLVLVFLC